MTDPEPNTFKQRVYDVVSFIILVAFFTVFLGSMFLIGASLIWEAWDTPTKPLNDEHLWERRDWDTTYGFYPEEIRQEMRKRYELHKKHEQLDQD